MTFFKIILILLSQKIYNFLKSLEEERRFIVNNYNDYIINGWDIHLLKYAITGFSLRITFAIRILISLFVRLSLCYKFYKTENRKKEIMANWSLIYILCIPPCCSTGFIYVVARRAYTSDLMTYLLYLHSRPQHFIKTKTELPTQPFSTTSAWEMMRFMKMR